MNHLLLRLLTAVCYLRQENALLRWELTKIHARFARMAEIAKDLRPARKRSLDIEGN